MQAIFIKFIMSRRLLLGLVSTELSRVGGWGDAVFLGLGLGV
jgi:hypothetical protein